MRRRASDWLLLGRGREYVCCASMAGLGGIGDGAVILLERTSEEAGSIRGRGKGRMDGTSWGFD
jgi:hypothetical protein